MKCVDFEVYKKAIVGIDNKKEILIDKENPLRYDVWGTTGKHLKDMLNNLSVKALPEENNSVSIFNKLKGTFKRIANNENRPTKFLADIINIEDGTVHEDGTVFNENDNIKMSIALYEVMEAVKGESDAIRKSGLKVEEISTHDGILPAIIAARIAAVIGRKILFQQKFRIASSKDSPLKPEEVEGIYHAVGMNALEMLQTQGYVDVLTEASTFKSYINEADQGKAFKNKKTETQIVTNTLAIALNTKKLGIKAGSQEALYFTNRPKSDIADTQLAAITDMLSAIRQVTQPSKYLVPDEKTRMTKEDYSRVDEPKVKLGDTTDAVRKKLYEKDLVVQKPVHDLLKVLHEEVRATGLPATKIIKEAFVGLPGLLKSLFGFKNSDLYSIDKIESIDGQNLSKSTALDDIAEYYDLLMKDGEPTDLHMALKVGRNERLYYLNSVLNPHASKQSRAMLSPGKYTVAVSSDNFDYLVFQIGDFLDSSLTYNEIVDGGNARLETALGLFEEFKKAKTLEDKLIALSHMPKEFPGQDYAVLLTSLQAVQDVRNPVKGKITTEFPVSSDATASGGVLTFLQALGSNANIKSFLERIGMLVKDDNSIEVSSGVDVYSLMTEAVDDYVKSNKRAIAEDLGSPGKDVKGTIRDTLDLLFDKGRKARDFSKAPTMTFVYGQGKEGSIETITTSLADRIIDSMDSLDTRKYLAKLFNDDSYLSISSKKLNATENLYPAIKEALAASGMPKQIFSLLKASLKKEFLAEHESRSTRIWELVKSTVGNKVIKIMPPDAMLDGKKASTDLAKYGMPIAKVFEVMHRLPDGVDVLTRKEILHRTIMDVSTIHGIDSALLYHSLNDANFKSGVIVVHDQVIGTVEDVRAVEKAYALKAKEILVSYDIHEQMLESLKTYVPDIVTNPEYIALLSEIQASVAIKKELSEKFNENTSALIGNGDKHVEFAKGKTEVTPGTSGEVDIEEEIAATPVQEGTLGEKFKEAIKFKREENIDEQLKEAFAKQAEAEATVPVKSKANLSPKHRKEADELVKIIESGDYAVLDTETTGFEPEDHVVHQIAVKVGNKTTIMNLPIDATAMSSMDSGFLNLYTQANPEVQFDKSSLEATRRGVFKHINSKVNTTHAKAYKDLERLLKGKNVLAHNSEFDKKMLEALGGDFTKVFNKSNVLDTLPLFFASKEEQILGYYQGRPETSRNLNFKQATFVKELAAAGVSGLKTDGTEHTAGTDVNNLDIIVKELAKREIAKKNGSTTSETVIKNISAQELLSDYAKDSELIDTFIKVFDTKVQVGGDDSFNPSTDTITIARNNRPRAEVIEAVEHEIVHAATIAQINQALAGEGSKDLQNDVKYFQKAISTLHGRKKGLTPKAFTRLNYILGQPEGVQQISEFVAVMTTEKDVATEIYGLFPNGKANLGARIKQFVNRVKMRIAKLTGADFKKEVDPRKLYGALQRTLETGISDRVSNQEETIKILSEIEGNYGFNAKPSLTDLDFLNKAVSRLIMDRAAEKGRTLSENTHELLSNYTVYTEAVDKLRGVYDSSEDLQQLMRTITGVGVDLSKKAFVLAEYAKVTAQRNDFIQKHIGDFEKLTKDLSDEDKATLDNAITKVPLHEYFVQAKEFNTVEKINEEVTRLEREVGSPALQDINNLVALNVEDKVTGKIYNLESYKAKNTKGKTTEYTANVHKLLALKSIQAIGTKKFVKLLKNEELMARVQDQVTANHLSLIGVGNKSHLRATGIPHSYDEGIQQEAITLAELPAYEYGDNSGWIVITPPTEDTLGLVYRKVIDSTQLSGAFTDIKLSSSDIILNPNRPSFDKVKNFKNVMETPDGFKMILTEEQRTAMGSLGAIQSLVRSTAHALSIKESQIIRDTLLEQETTFTVSLKNKKKLERMMGDSSRDIPWFLKADGITYGELPDNVKARYKPVGKRISNVDNFDQQVTWVRKDISHWLVGGNLDSPFTNPKWRWGMRITKDLVAMAKIGMVIMNPGKIARDNISNLAYLGVMGVDPIFAAKNYNEIMEQFGRYSDDKNKLLDLKVKLMVDPDNVELKAKDKAIRKSLDQNPITSIEDKGFLNSLGSALISRQSETLGGAQKDIDTALTYLLKQKDGKNNYLAHFLLALQKAGFQGEDFLKHLGNVVRRSKAGEGMERELDKIHERLSDIRSEKDVVAYAAQFINAPQSTAVRLGANITDLTDVMAKETYYRYLVSKGMSEEKAKVEVLEAFPNYIENMPIRVQQLSDAGIVMFPSFWMRIQKAIYRMAKDRPLSLAAEEAIDAYFGSNLDTIVDANIVNKATSWGGILHSPYENDLIPTIFPTRVFSL